jgi:phosphinothricin acetyltransferase
MYISLFEILRLQGFRMAFAAIVLPNDPSIALHKSVGFSAIGEFKSVGYKLGEWQDMGWWQLDLLPTELKPASHTSLPEVENSDQFRRAIKAGLAELH